MKQMKHIRSYKLFCEDYKEMMDNMVSTVDFDQIDKSNQQIDKLKTTIEEKKKELEIKMDSLDKLQIDSYSDENKDLLEKNKKIIKDAIDKLTIDIKSLDDSIKTIKEQIAKIKQNN